MLTASEPTLCKIGVTPDPAIWGRLSHLLDECYGTLDALGTCRTRTVPCLFGARDYGVARSRGFAGYRAVFRRVLWDRSRGLSLPGVLDPPWRLGLPIPRDRECREEMGSPSLDGGTR
jgi:hypothetical protein